MTPLQDGNSALEEIRRAETTAALLESGLVDVRSGDFTYDPEGGDKQQAYCC